MKKLVLQLAMLDDNYNNLGLELTGRLKSKTEITNQTKPEWKAYAERTDIIGTEKVEEYEETWEIVKRDKTTMDLKILRRVLSTPKGRKKKEFIFNNFFSEKIAYEDWGTDELKKFGNIIVLEN